MPNEINKEIAEVMRKLKATVKDFDKKDRRKILVKASRPVVKAVRNKVPVGVRVHYRGKLPNRIKYNPGNLRRSVKRLSLRKSKDQFVGPQFARNKVLEYGGPGQPSDGYYASMLYGSAANFNNRVLAPAAATASSEVLGTVKREAKAAIIAQAGKNGIKTA